LNRTFDFGFGGVVATHGVNRDGQHGSAAQLLFGYLNHFAAFVFPAVRAHAMRQLGLVAIGAFGDHRTGKRVVGPARRSAALGVSSFGIWHFVFLL
jgi:hypothetical protein